MKMLVGYDGSNAAMDALKLAVKHAKAFNAGIEVVRSLVGGGEEQEGRIGVANDQLAFAEDYIKKEGISCETHLLIRGLTAGEDLVKFAKDENTRGANSKQ